MQTEGEWCVSAVAAMEHPSITPLTLAGNVYVRCRVYGIEPSSQRADLGLHASEDHGDQYHETHNCL